ncbi:uncharacterized protein [Hyperolius riggenbachi]|uniref:uncharacterized protein n=1 Tax=Hyperolius riggenbachi TaxID=752182 RepID=UPI0035A325FC
MSKGFRMLLTSIPSKKKPQGSFRFILNLKVLNKCINKVQKVQNGQHSLCHSSPTERLFPGILRPQGCLLAHPNAYLIPTVSEIRSSNRREESKNNFSKKGHVSTRTFNGQLSSSTMEPISYENSANMDSKSLEQEVVNAGQKDIDTPLCESLPDVVAGSISHRRRSYVELSGSESADDGCQFLGMGSPLRFLASPGSMVQDNVFEVIKQQRAGSSLSGFTTFQYSSQEYTCNSQNRQQLCSSISEQTRGDKEYDLMDPDFSDRFLGRKQCQILDGSPPERHIKFPGRFLEPFEVRPERMVPQSSGLSADSGSMGTPGGGSICQENEYEMSKVLFPISAGQSLETGCILNKLGITSDVRFSTHTSFTKGTEEDHSGSSQSNSHRSTMAKETLVHITSSYSSLKTDHTPTSNRSIEPGANFSPESETPSPLSMEAEWRILKDKGFSNRLTETLIQSRKKVTRQIYNKAWKVFKRWCAERSLEATSSSSVLEFLQSGYEKGLSASTLKVQVSALSVFLERKLAQEEFVIRFFQALKRLRPVMRPRIPSWDLNTVLQGLCEAPFEPIENISDKYLS